MLCGMSVMVGAYTFPPYAWKVQSVITKYFGFSRASKQSTGLTGPESEIVLPDLSGTAMAGTFACRQTEIIHDAAGPAGFGPAAAAEFLHAVCQQILMILAHVGIGQIFTIAVKAADFFADLIFSHASAYPDGFVIQSGHSDSVNGRLIWPKNRRLVWPDDRP